MIESLRHVVLGLLARGIGVSAIDQCSPVSVAAQSFTKFAERAPVAKRIQFTHDLKRLVPCRTIDGLVVCGAVGRLQS